MSSFEGLDSKNAEMTSKLAFLAKKLNKFSILQKTIYWKNNHTKMNENTKKHGIL